MAIRRRSSSPLRVGRRQGRSASGSCRSPTDPDAACPRCTTRVENAHGTGVREVLYRWHPWFGLDVHVHAAITKSDGVYFRCTLNGADGARWQELPAWMFDRAACVGPCMLVAERGLSAREAIYSPADMTNPSAIAEVPAVPIGDDLFWDGGILSNTPVEVVFDDNPRRNALVFAAHIWHPRGVEPETIWQVFNRHKDLQYSSRAVSHIARQRQIHRLRHVVAELTKLLPEADRASETVRALAAYGCLTRMHVIRLLAPPLEGEDHSKDIDFS